MLRQMDLGWRLLRLPVERKHLGAGRGKTAAKTERAAGAINVRADALLVAFAQQGREKTFCSRIPGPRRVGALGRKVRRVPRVSFRTFSGWRALCGCWEVRRLR